MACPSSGLPSEQFLWNVFQQVDKDKSGYISADELQNALSNGTWSAFNMNTVKLIISMFDRENRGGISFREFGALWQYINDWQNCFHKFDQNNSGNIDRQELKLALSSFGYRLSEHIIKMLLQKFDRFGQGNILFDDFIQCCIILHTITVAFKQYDTDVDGVITIDYEHFLRIILSIQV